MLMLVLMTRTAHPPSQQLVFISCPHEAEARLSNSYSRLGGKGHGSPGLESTVLESLSAVSARESRGDRNAAGLMVVDAAVAQGLP